jgi:putative ABC transport system substrate-binding protein
MKRRQFVFSAASMLAAAGLRAQTPRLRRVAIAAPHASELPNEGLVAFRKRMGELGWIEGRSIEYVFAYAGGDVGRYEPVIAGLLAQKPDVLYAYFGPMALTARKLTREVPIVFTIVPDPVAYGLVASLARPGGNVTGASTRAVELDGKRFELLREIKPGIRRVAVVVNPSAPDVAKRFIDSYSVIARKLEVQLLTVEVRDAEEIPAAFDRMVLEGAQGLLGTADATHLLKMRAQLTSNAARVGIPSMFVDDRYVESGGLASYGTDNVDQIGRRGAAYVDKILRGTKPADLPVQEPTHFLMALNLSTARKLKLTIPQSVLLRADRVIE